jgi:uncharacterized SAM-binding protein YcdF (DUF218 family)
VVFCYLVKIISDGNIRAENVTNKREVSMNSLIAAEIVLRFLVDAVPDEELPVSDVIFVFGNTDLRVAHQAAALFRAQKAHRILVSGGTGPKTVLPKGYKTEAEYYAGIMEDKGIPRSVMILEDRATNTLENVLLGMERYRAVVGNGPFQAIAVAMPPLLRRALATFRKHNPEIPILGSAFQPMDRTEWFNARWLARGLAEIDRLTAYAEKGDIRPVLIPPDVAEAVAMLRRLSESEQC